MKLRKLIFIVIIVICVCFIVSGCNCGNKVVVVETRVVEAINDAHFDFLQQYNAQSLQLISHLKRCGELSEAVFKIDKIIIDKRGNPFISWIVSGRKDLYWYYIPGITITPTLFTHFSPLGISWDKQSHLSSIISAVTNDGDIAFYQFQESEAMEDKKDSKTWGILKMIKWDGEKFSKVNQIELPKLDKRILKLFEGGIGIGDIISRKGLEEFIIIGGGSEESLYLKELILKGRVDNIKEHNYKTIFAVWKDGKWKDCGRLADEGKFRVQGEDLVSKKEGHIYAVWGEASDILTDTKYPARISFDMFNGQKWEGNREISVGITLPCEHPRIVLDKMDKCHIIWIAENTKTEPEKYYCCYRQYSDNLKFSDTEKFVIEDKYLSCYLTCNSQNQPVIYWLTQGGAYCKVRISDKQWSETYCLLQNRGISHLYMTFDVENNIHLLIGIIKSIEEVHELYYTKLSYKGNSNNPKEPDKPK